MSRSSRTRPASVESWPKLALGAVGPLLVVAAIVLAWRAQNSARHTEWARLEQCNRELRITLTEPGYLVPLSWCALGMAVAGVLVAVWWMLRRRTGNRMAPVLTAVAGVLATGYALLVVQVVAATATVPIGGCGG